MPVYTYECKNENCKKIQELTRSISERNDEVNCICGEEMNLIISTCSFSLVGSCWAKDGYK